MEYEKKYRDLVEAVKELQEANPSDDGIQNWVNDNVPELAESEDERIRKEIISALKYANHKGVYDKHLAWLEKQGEKKSIDDLTQQEAMDIAIAKCFEQGEQKPAEKVEPKFKVRDWVVNQHGYIRQIIDIKDDCYYCIRTESSDSIENPWHGTVSYVDEQWHKWSIKDAKDGDVLALSYASRNYIQIYKRLYEKGFKTIMSVYCYYCVEEDTYYDETDSFHVMNRGEIITPATKEQRDTLLKAMADAGYTFDFEKKELKKVEQTSADETPYPETLEKAIDLYYYSYGNGEGEFEHLSLEKFRDIVHTFVSDYGQKPAWSEEELDSITAAINNLEYLKNNYVYHQMGLEPAITFLKSLKDRVQPQPQQGWSEEDYNKIETIACHLDNTDNEGMAEVLRNIRDKYYDTIPQNTWKPSDEQIIELRRVISGCSYDIEPLAEMAEQLKKLKE